MGIMRKRTLDRRKHRANFGQQFTGVLRQTSSTVRRHIRSTLRMDCRKRVCFETSMSIAEGTILG